MAADVLVGTQWGDEGKGKVTDLISGDYDVVCRYAGGANAGHTVIANGKKLALHQVPSGVMYPNTVPVIGNGCIVDPSILLEEIDMLTEQGIASPPSETRTPYWCSPSRASPAMTSRFPATLTS